MLRNGPWQERLDQVLSASAQKPSRERLAQIRIFEELSGLATKAATMPSAALPAHGRGRTRR